MIGLSDVMTQSGRLPVLAHGRGQVGAEQPGRKDLSCSDAS